MGTYNRGIMMDTMKVVIKEKAGPGLKLSEKPVPVLEKDDWVKIKILAASVCGTDMHIDEWDEWSQQRVKPGTTVGHELAGEIVEIGKNVKNLKVGDIVACETHIVCEVCDLCLTGNAHVCKETEIIGVHVDGAFAEYICMPESNCRPQPKDIEPKYLSVLEPFGNAVHTVTRFEVKDQIVAVVGCGPIGLMAVNLAKVLGAKKVIAVEIDEYRINMAKELGADVCINPIEEDVVARMMEESNQKGIDVICEFSGNAGAMETMFKYVGLNGKISILGIPRRDLTIDFANDIVFKGVTIYGVVGRKMYETWDKAAEIVKTGKVDFEKIVTNTFPLENFQDAIDLMKSGKCGKIVLIPNHK